SAPQKSLATQSTSSSQKTLAHTLPPRGSARHSSVSAQAKSSQLLSTHSREPPSSIWQRWPGPQPSRPQGLVIGIPTLPSLPAPSSSVGRNVPVEAPEPGSPEPAPLPS